MHDKVQVKPPKRQFLSPDFVRAMLAGHSALGLAFAALIYVVCLTGTVSVFLFELQRWEQPDGPRVTETPSPEAIAAAVHAGYEQARADNAAHDLFVSAPPRTPQRIMVSYHDHATGVEGAWLADAGGRLVTRTSVAWSEFITFLHMHLHLPRTWGKYLVGLTGCVTVSGLVTPPVIKMESENYMSQQADARGGPSQPRRRIPLMSFPGECEDGSPRGVHRNSDPDCDSG